MLLAACWANMEVPGVKGWMPVCELAVGRPDEVGLTTSVELLLGGVRRLPTLVNVVAGVGFTPGYCWYFWCSPESGGGGSSKLGRLEAFGLRAVKLAGAPI